MTLLESARDILLLAREIKVAVDHQVLSSCGRQSYVKETGRTDFKLPSGTRTSLTASLSSNCDTNLNAFVTSDPGACST